MSYPFMADFLVLIHFFWILFILFGMVFVLMGSRLLYLHLGGLLFSLFLNMMGYYCPLTYLENSLRSWGEHPPHEGSFVSRYVAPLVYPDLPEELIRAGEMVFVVMNLTVYAFWYKKCLARRR
jgi:hypothetical protein